jgi:beta-lactamase superfamily II metal-dependent hydrolase
MLTKVLGALLWVGMALGLALYAQARNTLDIYVIDVEGGQATLFVSPSGQSMLFDTGNPGGRDAERIVAAAKDVGVSRIDYLVISHFHGDHIGGAAEVAVKLPITTFVDYGSMVEKGERGLAIFKTYDDVRMKGRHVIARPESRIPIEGLEVKVVAADHAGPLTPAQGKGLANPLCADFTPKPVDQSENGRSVGIIVRLGAFSMLDLGDLTWNYEQKLVCPNNLLGNVDVYLTTHHGLNLSGPRAIVHALRPRVALMNNGPRKGASREAWTIVKTSPGLEDLWQLHYSEQRPANPGFDELSESGGPALNVAPEFIANLDETTAHYLKVTARSDGSFIVTNPRTGRSKAYPAQAR